LVIGNRIQKINVLLAAERDELKRLTGCDDDATSEYFAAVQILAGMAASTSKTVRARALQDSLDLLAPLRARL
jgi:hypothetical protein